MPKINVANPSTCQQKVFDIEDEHKMMPFWEKRMGTELSAECLGDEWKGYVVRITGGNDKQGFPMKQGVLKNGRRCWREGWVVGGGVGGWVVGGGVEEWWLVLSDVESLVELFVESVVELLEERVRE